jgi:carbamoyltransferase
MRDRINALVKQREAFRPFAPAALWDKAGEHFDIDHPSPFMLESCQVRSQLDLPAITHVDGSARLQTVDRQVNPRFARLLEKFNERTGCPILLNTSFNMKGEPIVCTPADAFACFVRSRMDALVIEGLLLDQAAIPPLWQLVSLVWSPPAPENASQVISSEVYTLL